jgi:hypothetical protein
MTDSFGSKLRVGSITASLAVVFLLASGCGPVEESGQPKPPPNPSPRADQGETVQPKLPRPEDISRVEKDLHKDLAPPPLIGPNVPATPTTPPTPAKP